MTADYPSHPLSLLDRRWGAVRRLLFEDGLKVELILCQRDTYAVGLKVTKPSGKVFSAEFLFGEVPFPESVNPEKPGWGIRRIEWFPGNEVFRSWIPFPFGDPVAYEREVDKYMARFVEIVRSYT